MGLISRFTSSDVVGWGGADARRPRGHRPAPWGPPAPARLPRRGGHLVGVVVVATERVDQPPPEPWAPPGRWTVVPHTGLGAWVTCTTGPSSWAAQPFGGRRRRRRDGRAACRRSTSRRLTRGRPRRGDGARSPRADHPARPQPAHARGGLVPPHLRDVDVDLHHSPRRPPSTSAGSPWTSSRPPSSTWPSATAPARPVRAPADGRRPDKAIAAITPSAVHLQVVNPSWWPAFPWSSWPPPTTLLPMSYWTIRRGDLRNGRAYTGGNLGRIHASLGDPDIPIVPVGGLAEDSTVGRPRGDGRGHRGPGRPGRWPLRLGDVDR